MVKRSWEEWTRSSRKGKRRWRRVVKHGSAREGHVWYIWGEVGDGGVSIRVIGVHISSCSLLAFRRRRWRRYHEGRLPTLRLWLQSLLRCVYLNLNRSALTSMFSSYCHSYTLIWSFWTTYSYVYLHTCGSWSGQWAGWVIPSEGVSESPARLVYAKAGVIQITVSCFGGSPMHSHRGILGLQVSCRIRNKLIEVVLSSILAFLSFFGLYK